MVAVTNGATYHSLGAPSIRVEDGLDGDDEEGAVTGGDGGDLVTRVDADVQRDASACAATVAVRGAVEVVADDVALI